MLKQAILTPQLAPETFSNRFLEWLFLVTDCQLGSQGEERNFSSLNGGGRVAVVKAMILQCKSIVIAV